MPTPTDNPQFTINGQPMVELRPLLRGSETESHFTSARLLPGRGMNVLQLEAFLPGCGNISLLSSPTPDEAKQELEAENPADSNGNLSFGFGGALLAPFANRIRGELQPDGKTLVVRANGELLRLTANWKGKNVGAEPHAMHGLILKRRMDRFDPQGHRLTAELLAGDFGGHWPSQTVLRFEAELEARKFRIRVLATNVGNDRLPMGIGWHPYFLIPSRQRDQARLHLPAHDRAIVNNYDDVFPTGRLEAVRSTPYDFNAPEGVPLQNLFLDDCFLSLPMPPIAELRDPASGYGMRIVAASSAIRAFQVYAPLDRPFVALEPQYNLGDPFGREWGGRDTGMVWLNPGQSSAYAVDLELFRA